MSICYTNTLETAGLSTGEILFQAKATLHAAHQRTCKALEMVDGLLRRHPGDADLMREYDRLFKASFALNNARSMLPEDIAEDPRTCPTVQLSGAEADALTDQAEDGEETMETRAQRLGL